MTNKEKLDKIMDEIESIRRDIEENEEASDYLNDAINNISDACEVLINPS